MAWFERKPTHAKQVEAAITVWGNLVERTSDSALDFQLPDSKLRYSVFCLATVQMACAPLMTNPDAVLNEVAHTIARLATEQPELVGSPPGTPQQLANQIGQHLEDYLHRWAAYIDIAKGGNAAAGTNIVCGMLRSTESDEPAADGDMQRLLPLASWIEASALQSMGQAFVHMARE